MSGDTLSSKKEIGINAAPFMRQESDAQLLILAAGIQYRHDPIRLQYAGGEFKLSNTP